MLSRASSKHNWKSRKLWFSVFAILMLLLGLVMSLDNPAFATVYATYAGSVVSVAGLFLAGNAAAKWINNKNPAFQQPHSEDSETSPSEETR